MTDGTVGVTDLNTSTVKTVDTSELTSTEGNTVERQRMVVADNSTAAAVALVTQSSLNGTEYGLSVRLAPGNEELGDITELLIYVLDELKKLNKKMELFT